MSKRTAAGLAVLAGAVALLAGAWQWPMEGFGAARTAANPSSEITTGNVASLTPLWQARLLGPGSAPTVADGLVFVTANRPPSAPGTTPPSPGAALYAYSAGGGATGCRPASTRCPSRWKRTYPALTEASAAGVANNRVFVDRDELNAQSVSGAVDAYSQGTGAPLYSAGFSGQPASPAVSGGVVFSSWGMRADTSPPSFGLQAMAAPSGQGSFVTVGPGGTSPATPFHRPAVSGGFLYAVNGSDLYAYDARGVQGCSPLPHPAFGYGVDCSPLWSATASAPLNGGPAVANGRVYVTTVDGQLLAFPAAGCGAATCSPAFVDQAPTGSGGLSGPAVTASTVYAGTSGGRLLAFPAAGCGAATCPPTWKSSKASGVEGPPSAAGGLVFVGNGDGRLRAYGASGCGHVVCGSLWHAQLAGAVTTAPAVVAGRLFVTDASGGLHAFALPS